MTSSNWKRRSLVLSLCLVCLPAVASLGGNEQSIDSERVRMHAYRSVRAQVGYTVHELTTADGSRIRQFVDASGQVFAVSWTAQHKPDLSALLGASFPTYAQAARTAGERGGVQRRFRHASADLIVQSNGHLHLFNGYALRRSLVPTAFVARDHGME